METRTTAQLRDAARTAEERGHYLTASELYQLAITRYPAQQGSQLVAADIQGLRECAKRCLQTHREIARETALPIEQRPVPLKTDPLTTTIRTAIDNRQRTSFHAEFNEAVRVSELARPEYAQ